MKTEQVRIKMVKKMFSFPPNSSFSSFIITLQSRRRLFTLIFHIKVGNLFSFPTCLEETLHIAVNTPQFLSVPARLRPIVLQRLRDQLQKRVMDIIGDQTLLDVAEISRRQMEANQYRSRILREVDAILASETLPSGEERVNGFQYSFTRGSTQVFSSTPPFGFLSEGLSGLQNSGISAGGLGEGEKKGVGVGVDDYDDYHNNEEEEEEEGCSSSWLGMTKRRRRMERERSIQHINQSYLASLGKELFGVKRR